MNDQTAKRIATALERMVEQNDEALEFHAKAAEAAKERRKTDDEILGYWRASEERNVAAERRKEADAAIKNITESIDRAKNIAAAREYLRLVDDDGTPLT